MDFKEMKKYDNFEKAIIYVEKGIQDKKVLVDNHIWIRNHVTP